MTADDDSPFYDPGFAVVFPVWAVAHEHGEMWLPGIKSVATAAVTDGRAVLICTDEDEAQRFITAEGVNYLVPVPLPNPYKLAGFLQALQRSGATHVRFGFHKHANCVPIEVAIDHIFRGLTNEGTKDSP